MKELLFIGFGLLALWYLSEPQLVAVVDTVPVGSVGIDLPGVSIRATGSPSGYVWAPEDARSVNGWLYAGPDITISAGGY